MTERGDSVNWTVSGKNIDVTPAIRAYLEKRLAKVLKHFDPERQQVVADVVLSVQRGEHKAEVTLKVDRLIVRSEARTSDLYASIDEAADRLGRQIRKYKTRLRRRAVDSPKLSAVADTLATADRAQPATDAAEADSANELPRVVRTKRFALKPMNIDEAVLQMELLGHDFFVFANAETEEVNVLYRRQDGNLGLIEPELG